MKTAKEQLEEWLARAGLVLGKDIVVTNPDTYTRVLGGGSIGTGEAYMDGWWDSPHLDEVTAKLMMSDIHEEPFRNPYTLIPIFLSVAKAYILNHQSRAKAEEVADAHYNIDNSLFERMLGKWMMYSCAYFGRGAQSLDEAQEHKMMLIGEKLKLAPGMRLLSIGCGWGQLEHFLAEKFKVSIVGISIAKEQISYAKEHFSHPNVEYRFQDYREMPKEETYDRVMSIAMLEAVGHKNFRTFFEVARKHLRDEGIFLLHTIGSFRTVYNTDEWLDKYIFPNGMLPSVQQLAKASERLFVMEDWHNFGADYDKTLMAWCANFEKIWPEIKGKYDERFYRMWKYYLLTCAGSFRARHNQLWQIVFTKKGLPGGYVPVR